MNKKNKVKDSPFSTLAGLKKKLQEEDLEKKTRAVAEKKTTTILSRELSEAELFEAAMRGVKTLGERPSYIPKKEKAITPQTLNDDEEVLFALEELVAGNGHMNFDFSDEFVEGRAADFSKTLFEQLKRGEFAVEANLDLHGMDRETAQKAVLKFFTEAHRKSQRCVLIVCGRGLRSPGGMPVLKELLIKWLVRGSLSRRVLGFCSARPQDGGVGAIYVFLRKNFS